VLSLQKEANVEFVKELVAFVAEVLLALGMWYMVGLLAALAGNLIFGVTNRSKANLKNAFVAAMLGPLLAIFIVIVLRQRAKDRKAKSTASGPA